MSSPQPIDVVGITGVLGTVRGWPTEGMVTLILQDGRSVLVPAELFTCRDDGKLFLPLRSDELTDPVVDLPSTDAPREPERLTIPIAQEKINVAVERIASGRVRVHIVPQRRTEVVDAPVIDERVEVARVKADRWVERFEPSREEGDETIVPVHEEVLVVTKRIRVKEEIHLRRVRTARQEPREVEVREEQAEVSRAPLPETAPAGGAENADATAQA